MSRKIKHDVAFKLQVVHQIIKGKESVDSLSIKVTIADSLIKMGRNKTPFHRIRPALQLLHGSKLLRVSAGRDLQKSRRHQSFRSTEDSRTSKKKPDRVSSPNQE